jgi:hypothetical protein
MGRVANRNRDRRAPQTRRINTNLDPGPRLAQQTLQKIADP